MLIIATKIKAVMMISVLYRRGRFTDCASDHPEIRVKDSRLHGKPEGAMKYNRPGQAPVGGVGSRRRVLRILHRRQTAAHWTLPEAHPLLFDDVVVGPPQQRGGYGENQAPWQP